MNREQRLERIANAMTVKEYAKKVETFLELWREEMISDIELVDSIDRLSKDVVVIHNNHVVVPESRILPRKPQA